ncbi:unnamed protein product [Nezara viridula]|uniref:Uncharacterized protein n=1 Tax=Nezara viridula TaxID=85310 RepID=A0A9P0EAC8_NEZVI|nr:unnamed protein product [Nezara viridula]
MWLSYFIRVFIMIFDLIRAFVGYIYNVIRTTVRTFNFSPAWIRQIMTTEEDLALERDLVIEAMDYSEESDYRMINRWNYQPIIISKALRNRSFRQTSLYDEDEDSLDEIFTDANQSQVDPRYVPGEDLF